MHLIFSPCNLCKKDVTEHKLSIGNQVGEVVITDMIFIS